MGYAAHMVKIKMHTRFQLGYQKEKATWKTQGIDRRTLKWI
jgi:hypothetical protein